MHCPIKRTAERAAEIFALRGIEYGLFRNDG